MTVRQLLEYIAEDEPSPHDMTDLIRLADEVLDRRKFGRLIRPDGSIDLNEAERLLARIRDGR